MSVLTPRGASAQDRSQSRSMVQSRQGVVASESVLASQVGVAVLERGGNATDAAAGGAAAFYTGPVAAKLLASSNSQGGTMTAADLAEYEPEWVDPISTTYRGWTVYELPPNGQGIAALEMLNIMETFPLATMGHNSVAALHHMIEAKKLAYADMQKFDGDPRFVTTPKVTMVARMSRIAPRSRLHPYGHPPRPRGRTSAGVSHDSSHARRSHGCAAAGPR